MSTKTLGKVVVTATAVLGLGGLASAPAANAATAAAPTMSVASVSTARPLLHSGSRGPAVRTWQIDVNRVAGKIPGVPYLRQDGVFGPRTAAATRAFQRYAHIRVDGIVGPQTRRAMDTALHGAPTP